jgi:hypothetical protein
MSSSKESPAVHHHDTRGTNSYAEPKLDSRPAEKGYLMTWPDMKQQWESGSRRRVIAHLVVPPLVGVFIGWVVMTVVGAATRYS